MSSLSSATASGQGINAQRELHAQLILGWVEEKFPQRAPEVAAVRAQRQLAAAAPPLPYEVVIAPMGTGFEATLREVAAELANQLDIVIDMVVLDDASSKKSTIDDSLAARTYQERFESKFADADTPSLGLVVLDSVRDPEAVMEYLKTRPTALVLRRHREASAEALMEIQFVEEKRSMMVPLSSAMRGRVGAFVREAPSLLVDHPMLEKALRVIGVEMGKTGALHPFQQLAAQDARLAGLYVAARAAQLEVSPLPPVPQAANGSDPHVLEAVVFNHPSKFLGQMMLTRCLTQAPGLSEEFQALPANATPTEWFLAKLAEQGLPLSAASAEPAAVLSALERRLQQFPARPPRA